MMIEIPLTKGYTTIIDDCDSDLAQAQYKWKARLNRGVPYAVRYSWVNKKKKTVYLHREILERMIGRPLMRQHQTDHIHGLTLDNRRSEIRLATYTQNSHNTGIRKNNTSGYKGVSYSAHRKKFCATMQLKGRKLHLGWFDDPAMAHAAYCQAAIKYHGEFANFGHYENKPATIIQLPLFDLDKVA